MTLSDAQQAEIAKYDKIYREVPNYRISDRRKYEAYEAIQLVTDERTKTLLDVGAGRGEIVRAALDLYGYSRAVGIESCGYLCDEKTVFNGLAWDLPFEAGAFDVVTCLDVIEHILRGDDERTVRECMRVAKRYFIVTANNKPSQSLGVELHVNKRPYEEWDKLFRQWTRCKTTWYSKGRHWVSELWIISL